MGGFFRGLPDLTVETDEVRDLGDVMLVRGRLSGHGAGSGASFERTLSEAVELRDKKTVWWWGSCFTKSSPTSIDAISMPTWR